MANTLGTAERMILTSAIEAFHETLAPVQAFSFSAFNEDNGSAAGIEGTSVIVKVASGGTASNYAGTYKTGNQTFTDKTVTLDRHKVAGFHLTDLEATKHRFNIIEAAAVEAAQALAEAVFSDICDLFRIGTGYTNATVVETAMDADDIVDLRKLLNDLKVPKMNRSIVCTPGSFVGLLKDNSLQDASASGSTAVLREGVSGRVAGFDIWETNGLSTTVTAGTSNVHTIAVHPQAIATALRTVPPSNSTAAAQAGLRYGEMRHPETGITLGMRAFYDASNGTDYGAFECLWGRAQVKTTAAYLYKNN